MNHNNPTPPHSQQERTGPSAAAGPHRPDRATGPSGGTVPAAAPGTTGEALSTVRARVASGRYVPGTRLTLTELAAGTGHTSRQLRPALEQLAAEGVITADRRIPDTRPQDHGATRTRNLLASMISHGAYPAATPLPTRGILTSILLAGRTDLHQALRLLAAEQVISLSGNARPRVLSSGTGAPGPSPWPPGPGQVLGALPAVRRPGAGHDRATLAQVRRTARERWRSGLGPAPEAMTDQEQRQAETLHRLITRALDHTSGGDPRSCTAVRSAAARSMACAALPTHGPLHERLFRFAVLATALHDLIEALVCCPSFHRAGRRV
ncbi:GntR family transcriptional regulator [Streptomyces sp. CFMR 7]|uniref:GntR family transcriptional regulator n=1 Tax=Streptomyces sp. CFMR 7 TaxID=1649184 RepID=UPI0011A608CD|nr:GntR family transcriptional regulator [Streptomyces sp. CFMR 7]